jgi:hypothetical protein
MERHPNVRPSFTALLALGLVLALAACGSVLDTAIVEGDQEIETIVDVVEPGTPGDVDAPGETEAPEGAAPPLPSDGDTTYDQPPTIDGQPVTEEDLADGIPDGAVLEGDFSGWDFSDMDFKNVIMSGARFDGAKFIRTKFSGSVLHYGSFIGADFTGARLMGADLSYGNFTRAIFTDAVMPGESFKRYGAIFDGATWTDGVRVCLVGSIGDCN